MEIPRMTAGADSPTVDGFLANAKRAVRLRRRRDDDAIQEFLLLAEETKGLQSEALPVATGP